MNIRKIKTALRRTVSSVTAAGLCFGAMLFYAPGSSALTEEEIRDKINQCQQNIDYYQELINNMQDDISDNREALETIKSKLDDEKAVMDYYNNLVYYKNEDIAAIEKKIEELKKDIEDTEKKIEDKEADIKKLSDENQKNLEKFAEMIRALYVSGNDDIFAILAGSSSFYDFMVRSEIVNNMSEKNLEFMNALIRDIEKLNSDIKLLETDKALLEEKIKKRNDEIARLKEERDKYQELADKANEASNNYKNEYNKYYDKLSDLLAEEEDYENKQQLNKNDLENFENQLKELIKQNQNKDRPLQEGEWIWPLPGRSKITTYFGYDSWLDRIHKGIDIGDGGIQGDHILASKAGTVIIADHTYIPGYSYGMYVVVDHGGGYTTTYGHMQEVYVNVGDEVAQGQALGEVGNTGYSFGYHLHFEIRLDGVPLDPFNYVQIAY